MIFRSIKWRMQLWHGVILLLVLGGFGYTAFELQRTREFRRVDQELHDHMGALLGNMRRPGRPPNQRDFPRRDPRLDSDNPADPDRPPDFPRGRPPSGPPPEIGRDSDAAFPEEGPFFYVVSDREGHIIRSRGLREDYVPAPRQTRSGIVTRDGYRELFQVMPRGENVVVGRSLHAELNEMRNLALILFGSGAGILALGLAGGWLVATRAMQPIEQITTTAQKIASGDLTQRIAHEESESELGRLVAVLNSTFARLESSFADQVRFTTDVSHELRTPVSVIVSQTQMALSRERAASEYRESLEACQRAAQRMRRLIESLLQLARLDAGQEEIRKIEFDLAKAAEEAIDLLCLRADERKVELILELQSVWSLGDSDRISQAVTNLISNAIHYTPEGGRVTISTAEENQLAVLTVSDTGVGIPAEDLPHVFDRFYRVDTSRSRDKGGSGLGLAITRAVIHAHGGTIDVASETSHGSRFTVRLPLGKKVHAQP